MDRTHLEKHRLFPNTPDTSCYYPATTHEQALDQIQRGLENQEPILVLTGETGMGKTLLSHCLLERIGESRPSLVLTNSHVRDRSALFQALLYDLGKPYEGRSEQEMRLAITEYLLVNFQQGLSTILFIDEAQHLSVDLLEELRLLGNLEAQHQRAVQIVLMGQPRLVRTLSRPELKALNQRLVVRAELQSLETQEAADYLLHHLRLAGPGKEKLFSIEALELLVQGGQGVPRLLNKTAQLAIGFAHQNELDRIDAEVVLEVFNILGITIPDGDGEEPSSLIHPENALIGSIGEEIKENEPNVLAFGSEEPVMESQPLLSPRRPA